MKTVTRKVKAPKVNREVEYKVSVPTSCVEASKVFGEDVALGLLLGALAVRDQSVSRAKLEQTGDERLTNPKIIEYMEGWKPTAGGARLSVEERVKRFRAEMDKYGITADQL